MRHPAFRPPLFLAATFVALTCFGVACSDSTEPKNGVDVTLAVTQLSGPFVVDRSAGRRINCVAYVKANARGSGTATWYAGAVLLYAGKDRSRFASGDTLVAVLPSRYSLAFVDLRRTPRQASLLRLTGLDSLKSEMPFSIGIVADGHVFVGPHGPSVDEVVEFDPTTGTQRKRADVTISQPGVCWLYPTPDRTTMFAGGACAARYDLATDGFTPIGANWSNPGTDADGTLVDWGRSVYDRNGLRIKSVGTQRSAGYLGRAALSLDGSILYSPRLDGLVAWRVSDGGGAHRRTAAALHRSTRRRTPRCARSRHHLGRRRVAVALRHVPLDDEADRCAAALTGWRPEGARRSERRVAGRALAAMHHPVRQDPHLGLLVPLDPRPALHAAGE